MTEGHYESECPLCPGLVIQAPTKWVLDQKVATHDAEIHDLPFVPGT